MSIISQALRKAQEKREQDRNLSPNKDMDESAWYAAFETEEDVTGPPKKKKDPRPSGSKLKFFSVIFVMLLAAVSALVWFDIGQVREDLSAVFPFDLTTLRSGRVDIESFSSGSRRQGLELSGVMYVNNEPRAVINGRTLSTGDTISRYRVISIDEAIVILNDGEKDLELRID